MLSQSDIFAHFGAGKKKVETTTSSKSKSRRAAGSGEELDEDEEAVVRELENEGEGGSSNKFINLKSQPSIITGGSMRQVILIKLSRVV